MSSGAGVEAVGPERREPVIVLLARATRIHQWSKNVLVFAPALLAHRIEVPLLARSFLAFVAFGCVASIAYVVNDVVDLEADRAHPRKRTRPFASGALPTSVAWALVPALLVAAVGIATALPPSFAVILASYVAATFAYSYWLKRRVVADVITLAALYTARLFAGALAVGVPVSEWLATFSMFLFLSLALVKRASELLDAGGALAGRGYQAADREVVLSMGTASAFMAVLVLALYISSPEVHRLYSNPRWLWALCPLVLYWTARMWIDTRRGRIDTDPLHYALTHRVTWAVASLGAAVLYLAS